MILVVVQFLVQTTETIAAAIVVLGYNVAVGDILTTHSFTDHEAHLITCGDAVADGCYRIRSRPLNLGLQVQVTLVGALLDVPFTDGLSDILVRRYT